MPLVPEPLTALPLASVMDTAPLLAMMFSASTPGLLAPHASDNETPETAAVPPAATLADAGAVSAGSGLDPAPDPEPEPEDEPPPLEPDPPEPPEPPDGTTSTSKGSLPRLSEMLLALLALAIAAVPVTGS